MLLSMLTAFVFSGQASHASEPGFFRICYAIVDCETILQLVQRLVGFITKSDAERQQVPLWINTASMQKAKQEIEADSTQPAKPAFEWVVLLLHSFCSHVLWWQNGYPLWWFTSTYGVISWSLNLQSLTSNVWDSHRWGQFLQPSFRQGGWVVCPGHWLYQAQLQCAASCMRTFMHMLGFSMCLKADLGGLTDVYR